MMVEAEGEGETIFANIKTVQEVRTCAGDVTKLIIPVQIVSALKTKEREKKIQSLVNIILGVCSPKRFNVYLCGAY